MKKHIKGIIALLVIAVVVTGAVAFYFNYSSGKRVAQVVPVYNLNMGYWGDEMTSYGTVTNDSSQNIYLSDKQTVSEIYVEEGQQVSEGDPVISYDMESTQLAMEEKKLAIQKAENEITLTQSQLKKLRATTPVSESDGKQETQTITEPIGEEKSGEAYCYLGTGAMPYKGSGTAEDPYVYLCTSDCYMTAAFRNQMAANGVMAVFEVRENSSQTGNLLTSLTINGASLSTVEDGTFWMVATGEQKILEDDTVIEQPQDGYTQAELTQAITEKEQNLKELELTIKRAQLELSQLEEAAADGQVTATISGTVEKVGDPENPPTDGSAFIVISASDGLYVVGQLSELYLGQVQEGQMVQGMSWTSGMSFVATIESIDDYPSDATGYSDGQNNSVSYYNYTAYIEDAAGLENGEGVELTLTLESDATYNSNLYIGKEYVRQQDGQSYVLKQGEDGRLVKQTVTTGKTVWGSCIQILDGITEEDYIAFPYGKTAKEGIRCEVTDYIY